MCNSYSKKDYSKGEVNLVEITQTKDEVDVIKIPHKKATQNKTQCRYDKFFCFVTNIWKKLVFYVVLRAEKRVVCVVLL